MVTLWYLSGVLANTIYHVNPTKKSHKTFQLCPAILEPFQMQIGLGGGVGGW
jgi:hypothetical protein